MMNSESTGDTNVNSMEQALSIPELLAMIFIHCLPDDDLVYPSSECPPLSLALVCRMWCTIAFATPELWSSITFLRRAYNARHWFGVNVLNMDHVASVMDRWIIRSSNRPLDLCVPLKIGTNFLVEECILEAICAVRRRWRKLSVICSAAEGIRILQLLGTETPRLETISIYLQHWTEPWITDSSHTAISLMNAPMLHTFKCRGNRWSHADMALVPVMDCSAFGPSLSALTLRNCTLLFANDERTTSSPVSELDIILSDNTQVLGLYDSLRNTFANLTLLRLCFRHHGFAIQEMLLAPDIALDHLDTLDVDFESCHAQLFHRLVVPVLSKMSIRSRRRFDEWGDVIVMLQRSHAHLTSLTIDVPRCQLHHLRSLVQEMKSVRHFKISADNALRYVLSVFQPPLSWVTTPSVFCPHLEMLECPRYEHHVLYTAIINFIEHRCASSQINNVSNQDVPKFTKLRRISLFVSRECKRAVLLDPAIRRLVVHGLDIAWLNEAQVEYGIDLLDEFML